MISREFIYTFAWLTRRYAYQKFCLYFFSALPNFVSGLLGSIFTAHYLGPGGRGNYFYVITLALHY